MVEETTKKFCKILLLRPCGLSGYITRVAEDPYPNLWELKSHGYTYHGYTYKTTPKCAPEVLVDRNLCWSQLSTGHLWYFGVGVPHRGGWLKEQGLITSKSNIFSLYIYIIYMYIDLHLQYMYVYHVRVYGSTKRWTSDLNKTFLAVASGVFLHRMWRGSARLGCWVRGCDCRKEFKRFKKRSVGEMQCWRK